MNRFPSHKQSVSYAGVVISAVGLVGAAFSTRPIHFVITQGILFSIGGGELILPGETALGLIFFSSLLFPPCYIPPRVSS